MIYFVFDTETTGLKHQEHEIIQLAGIMCDSDLDELGRISFKLKPRWPERAQKKALEINGYDEKTWNPDFKTHKEALDSLNEWVSKINKSNDELVLVGQNIKFDMDFLQEEYSRTGVLYPFPYASLDLMTVAPIWAKHKDMRLKKRSLKYFCKITGAVNDNPHDAMADVEATLEVLKIFVSDLKKGDPYVRRKIGKQLSVKV